MKGSRLENYFAENGEEPSSLVQNQVLFIQIKSNQNATLQASKKENSRIINCPRRFDINSTF